MDQFYKNKKLGFTLIEIIVVLIVLGVLATIALSSYFQWIESSRQAEALPTIHTIRDKAQAYISTHVEILQAPFYSTAMTSNSTGEGPFTVNDLLSSHFNYAVGIRRHNFDPSENNIDIIVTAVRNCQDGGRFVYSGVPPNEVYNMIFYGMTFNETSSTVVSSGYCGFGYYNSSGGDIVCTSGLSSWFGIYGGTDFLTAVLNTISVC